MPTILLSLIRHGQVENPDDTYYGRLPRFGLSPEGRRQAQAAAGALRCARPAAVFSSPMLRCRQTAQIIAAAHPGLRVQAASALNEVYSPFDGCAQAELRRRGWDVYTGTAAPFEQPEDILRRAQGFLARLARRCPGQRCLAVTHGDLILFLTRWAAGQPLRGDGSPSRYPENGSITTLALSEDGARCLEWSYQVPTDLG